MIRYEFDINGCTIDVHLYQVDLIGNVLLLLKDDCVCIFILYFLDFVYMNMT